MTSANNTSKLDVGQCTTSACQTGHSHDHSHDHNHAAGDHSHEHSHDHDHSHAEQTAHAHEGACCSAPAIGPSVALAASTSTRLVVHIADMDCPAEENMIRSGLKKLDQVQNLGFDLMQRVLTVDHVDGARDKVLGALRGLGFEPRMADEEPVKQVSPKQGLIRIAGAVVLALAAEISHWLAAPEWLVIVLAVAAILSGGVQVYKKGWIALRNGQLNINALMSIAVTGAVILAQWPEAAMVMSLFSLAEWIEARSLDRARNAVDSLLKLVPDEVLVSADGKDWQRVPANQVQAGWQVRVAPGERFGLDGKVLQGLSTVNQAPITGESAPVDKEPGDEVFAGTINGMGELVYQVQAAHDETLLARITRSVQEAQANKAPIQRFVDQFSRIYTPLVVVAAALMAVALPLIWGVSWSESVYRALVLLVIACPCALVISTPVAVVSALASAARAGILIKGGVYLERARQLRYLAVDKTGTLTLGEPSLSEYGSLRPGLSDSEVLDMAVALAERSDHPASQAIARGRVASGLLSLDQFEALAGNGVQAEGSTGQLRLGKRSWVLGQNQAESSQAEQQAVESGATMVYLGDEQGLLAWFAMMDTLRPTTTQAIRDLQAQGVQVEVLSGDHEQAVRHVAQQAGIKDFRGGLLPQDKLDRIEEKLGKGLVAMVGDGINDAPALARADVGIAMGALGSDIAIETADVALMDDDLGKIALLMRQSRALHAVLWQNISLALGIKAVFLVMALTGQATMWMAVFADVGASLLVVLNSLRLLRARNP
ncbi:heavy metal translocating P-type ATPase [Alcaligenes faecalis]|uniref:heavy metal translocating P-type ATPase n=1 Tax=Alcaligenes faecalis TaxID=511 RepID=UPI001FF8EC96|nr:cation-translocating P-type ATPase [Alcaligenes faecalis]